MGLPPVTREPGGPVCRPYDFFCNIQKRRVQEAAPYGSAPAATCSAKPGADVESHQLQFLESQGPVARNEMIKATQILRAGNSASRDRYASPRNGGSRGRAAWRQGRRSRFCRLRPPPSGSLVTFWPSRKSLAAGAAKSSPHSRKGNGQTRWGRAPALQSSSNDACSSDCPLIRPSVRTGAPFPIPSVATRHLPLTRGVGPQGGRLLRIIISE